MAHEKVTCDVWSEHVRQFALVSRLKVRLELLEEDEGVLACGAHDVIKDETDDRDRSSGAPAV